MKLEVGKSYRLKHWPEDWWIEVRALTGEFVHYVDNRDIPSVTNLNLEWELL